MSKSINTKDVEKLYILDGVIKGFTRRLFKNIACVVGVDELLKDGYIKVKGDKYALTDKGVKFLKPHLKDRQINWPLISTYLIDAA